MRGLIEFTSFCKNNCFYCGLRRSNDRCERYRLTAEQILSCCEYGYPIGFRTFVLQGGEDGFYTNDMLCSIISEIKRRFPDCAVTLSVGERSYESYLALFNAGADRYLLRHETADSGHYSRLHPGKMSFANRMECLENLRKIGYQTGCGFMVGSPYQTVGNIADDLLFIRHFRPQMVGRGPFLPQSDTPFRDMPAGSAALTLRLLSIVRLMLPEVLLPATTALGTAARDGREQGIMAGANVVMPNLSPRDVRGKYLLYDNKLSTGCEAAESVEALRKSIEDTGYSLTIARGDSKM